MKKFKTEIAKIISSSGDLQGATWEELKKIEELANLFKSYARSLMPNGLSISGQVGALYKFIYSLFSFK